MPATQTMAEKTVTMTESEWLTARNILRHEYEGPMSDLLADKIDEQLDD